MMQKKVEELRSERREETVKQIHGRKIEKRERTGGKVGMAHPRWL